MNDVLRDRQLVEKLPCSTSRDATDSDIQAGIQRLHAIVGWRMVVDPLSGPGLDILSNGYMVSVVEHSPLGLSTDALLTTLCC